MQIAHISDLHFAKISKGLSQFFSKEWIGNLNLLLNRRRNFLPSRSHALLQPFKERGITDVIISGDLTTTSSKAEFCLAKQFVDSLREEGINVYLIPGNHDHYTRCAYQKKVFYQYFASTYGRDLPFNLVDHGVSAKRLSKGWWLVLIDTALATSLISSNGHFSISTENSLKQLLKEIPAQDKIILVNHFPFFQHDRPSRCLQRGTVLEDLIHKHPQIQFYLHGHTHRRCIADLRANGLPVVLDSGSISHQNGSWNLLDLTENSCALKLFKWEQNAWMQTENHEFMWEHG